MFSNCNQADLFLGTSASSLRFSSPSNRMHRNTNPYAVVADLHEIKDLIEETTHQLREASDIAMFAQGMKMLEPMCCTFENN